MKAKKGDIVHKLKIARGQLDGILQMVEENRYCVDISNQLLATQALLKKRQSADFASPYTKLRPGGPANGRCKSKTGRSPEITGKNDTVTTGAGRALCPFRS